MEDKALRLGSGRLSGRPPQGEVKNLLAGMATCAVCGRGLVVETSPRKRGGVPEYRCWSRRHDTNKCSNALHPRADAVNEAVLQAIEEHALTPEAIEQVIRLSERDDLRERRDTLARELKKIELRIGRLVEVVESGGDAESLVAKLRELEQTKAGLIAQAANLHPIPRLAREIVENRLAEWRRLLRGSVAQGRAVLQRIIRGRIVFSPPP